MILTHPGSGACLCLHHSDVRLAELQQQLAHLLLTEFVVQAQVPVRNHIGQFQAPLKIAAE